MLPQKTKQEYKNGIKYTGDCGKYDWEWNICVSVVSICNVNCVNIWKVIMWNKAANAIICNSYVFGWGHQPNSKFIRSYTMKRIILHTEYLLFLYTKNGNINICGAEYKRKTLRNGCCVDAVVMLKIPI